MGNIPLSLSKDWLLYTAFTVDALNTVVTFPMFVAFGPKWVLQSLDPKAKEKTDDPNVPSLADVDRKSFQLMWDLFMICYEGYFGFTVSSLLCIYKAPETLPIFGYSLLALYVYKLCVSLRSFDREDPQRKAKLYSMLGFFLPCYGGYCALHLYEYLASKP